MTPEPEQIGPYRFIEKLGSGGMGHVYLATRDDGRAMAAVKVLTASLAREGGFVERFNREIDSMRKLDNPHIVKLLDSGVDGENYYYAMEYVPGETLLALLRREKRLSWRRTVDISIQVCRALKSAHDTGIIHRDLKPSNLLVTGEGFIKLTDFGVAQVFAGSRLTATGGIIGTAEYMSPEQAQGKRATKQSDLYSLGALMYAMVTGRTPFSGSTAVEVIQKHKFGLFDRPSLYAPDLPQRVEDTICRLLEKDPAKRFPDAMVLSRHLEQLLRMEDYVSTGVTLADASSVRRDDPTLAVTTADGGSAPPSPGRGVGPATLMQGLLRAEIEEIDRGHWLSSLFNTLFVQVALLILVIAGGIWWFWRPKPSPREMFEEGVRIMQEEEGPAWLRARSDYFEPLLQADPQAWQERVEPYIRQIELYELTRPSRGVKRGKPAAFDSEAERLLKLALHYREIGDFARAERQLAAVRAILKDSPAEKDAKLYDLAGRLLDDLQKQQGDDAGRDQLLEAALTRAKKMVEAGKPAEAHDVWQAIVDLYGDEPAARRFVEAARQSLEGKPKRPDLQ